MKVNNNKKGDQIRQLESKVSDQSKTIITQSKEISQMRQAEEEFRDKIMKHIEEESSHSIAPPIHRSEVFKVWYENPLDSPGWYPSE